MCGPASPAVTWDEAEELGEITMEKFTEAEGPIEQADKIQYLSVHSEISPLILCY